jgi:signal transduction histidine kinase
MISDITGRKRAEQALQESRDALEERVAQRTEELRVKNAALEREIHDRHRAEKQLQESEERFRAALAEVADKEREKLKRDLHDGVCQQLTGLSFLAARLAADLEAIHHAEAATAAELGAIARSTARMAHDIGVELAPLPADPAGLQTALEELALRASRLHGIRCHATMPESVTIEDHNAATHLYLIAQEAVSNAARHSGSPEVRLQLARQGSTLILTVSDKGSGVAKKPATCTGIGIEIMHSRARLIGARLEITPGTDCGTVVTCAYPGPTGR